MYYRGMGIRAAAVPDVTTAVPDGAKPTTTSKKAKSTSSKHPKPTTTKHKPAPTAVPVDDPDGGGLLGILGQQEGDGQAPVGFVSDSAVDSASDGAPASASPNNAQPSDAVNAENFLGGADDDGEGDSLPWGTDDDDLLASLGTNVAIPISTTAVSSPSASPPETYSPGEQGQETGAAAGALMGTAAGALMGTAGAQVPWGVPTSASLITAAPSATSTSVASAAPTTTDDGLGFLGLQAGVQDGEEGTDDEGQASPHLARFRGLFFR